MKNRTTNFDHSEIIAIGLPVLIEAVCVTIAIGCMMALVAIFAAQVPV